MRDKCIEGVNDAAVLG